jgi:dienelactone hydrolase
MRSAAKLMSDWRGIDGKRLALVGYSYGAQIVIQGIRHFKKAKAMVLISPPLPSLKADGTAPEVGKDRRPRLFLAGGKDRLTSVKALQARVAAFSQQADFVVVPDADHSWRGHETVLAQRVTDFLTRVL